MRNKKIKCRLVKNVFIYSFLILSFVSNMVLGEDDSELNGSKLFFLNKNFGAFIKTNTIVAITTDGAKNWNEVEIESGAKLQQILFLSELEGWLLEETCLFYTQDGGSTWDKKETFDDYRLESIYFKGSDFGLIGGVKPDSENQVTSIHRTENSGVSWERAALDTSFGASIFEFSFADDSNGVALGHETAFRTDDSGNNWSRLPLNFKVTLDPNFPITIKYVDRDSLIYGPSVNLNTLIDAMP